MSEKAAANAAIYLVDTNEWIQLPNMQQERFAHALVLFEGIAMTYGIGTECLVTR